MASPLKYEDYLSSIYYDPKNAGAYGGVEKLYRAVRKDGKFVLGRSKIRNWLLKQEDYAVHRETRSKFKRKRVVAPFVDYQWDVDTANMASYRKANDGFAYFVWRQTSYPNSCGRYPCGLPRVKKWWKL